MAKMGRKTVWNKKREDAIISSIEKGASYKKAAKAAGICYDTLRERINNNSAFSALIKKAKEAQIQVIEGALFKTAAGLVDRTEVHYEAIKTPKGISDSVLVRTIKKKFAPNVAAQVFFLANRDPKNWKSIQHSKLFGTVGIEVTAEDIFRARQELKKKEKHEKEKKEQKKPSSAASHEKETS